jgi:hypothetical protein
MMGEEVQKFLAALAVDPRDARISQLEEQCGLLSDTASAALARSARLEEALRKIVEFHDLMEPNATYTLKGYMDEARAALASDPEPKDAGGAT